MKKKQTLYMAGPSITKLEEKIVMDAVKNGWYGKKSYYYCEKFEKCFSKYHNRKFALMTPNCTTAIHLLLAGLNIRDGDEVIVPDCTWIGSSAAIEYQKAKIIFADIDYDDWCISPESIINNITKKTKAIIAVNLYGNMAKWSKLKKIAKENKIFLIEDAAESLGSKYKNIRSGKFGTGSVFSFHRTKTLTSGEGGVLLLDDKNIFERCKLIRDHGRDPHSYVNLEIAFKYMPSNLQASLAFAQFKRINSLINKKKIILKLYKKNLLDIEDISLNPEPRHIVNGCWSPVLVIGKTHKITTEDMIKKLTKTNVPARPFFLPLSSLPAYKKYKPKKINKINKVSYDISNRAIVLPSALSITKEDIFYYCQIIRKILKVKN